VCGDWRGLREQAIKLPDELPFKTHPNLSSNPLVRPHRALLTAHDFRVERQLDVASLLQGVRDGTDEAYLLVGTMYLTYEWPFSFSVEIGIDRRGRSLQLGSKGTLAAMVCWWGSRLPLVSPPGSGAWMPTTSRFSELDRVEARAFPYVALPAARSSASSRTSVS
jgi:hypothetical protein